MRLLRQFQASLFFYENISSAQKHVTSKSQVTKQKQANKKQQRQQFSLAKTSKKTKIDYFSFWCFFYARNFFVKKEK